MWILFNKFVSFLTISIVDLSGLCHLQLDFQNSVLYLVLLQNEFYLLLVKVLFLGNFDIQCFNIRSMFSAM